MRKNDQILMWEAYIGESSEAVSMGGPLKVGGSKSPSKSSDDNSEDAEDEDADMGDDAEDVDGDPYEDEEGSQYDTKQVLALLNAVANGKMHPEEAARLLDQVMLHPDDKYIPDNEEDAENVKRPSRDKSIDGFLKNQGERPLAHGKGPPNVKRHSGEKETAKFRKAAGFSGKRTPDVSRDV